MPSPSCLIFLPRPYSTGYGFAALCYADCEKPEPGSAVILELDEFWHFMEFKKKGTSIYSKYENKIQKQQVIAQYFFVLR